MKPITWLFVSIPLILILSVGWLAISIARTFYFHNWSCFERSGSILTLCGATLAVRRLLRLGPERVFHETMFTDLGNIEQTKEEIEAARQTKLDIKASHIGIILVISGTLIWGYGGLIQHFFPAWSQSPNTSQAPKL